MNSLDKMEEANEERILKEGKVKSIYATKEIRSGDQLEVEIYPEFTKGQKDQIPDEELDAIQSQVKAEVDAAYEFAQNSPDPELSVAFEDVWVD